MTAVVVLGMHRSGTSMVASVLQALGVNMGENLVPPGYGNPLGFYEDVDFVSLNDRILRAAGGSWAEPPPEQSIREAGANFEVEISELIDARENQEENLWGWKDPRTSLTAELFLRHLADPYIVVCRRDRDAIIRSLLARDDTDQIRAEKTDDDEPFVFSEFFARLVADEYQARIDRLDAQNMFEIFYEDCRAAPLSVVSWLADWLNTYDAETVEKAAAMVQ